MKDKAKFELDKAGVRSILRSQMMMDAVMEIAPSQGEIDTSYVGTNRVHVIVKEDENAD